MNKIFLSITFSAFLMGCTDENRNSKGDNRMNLSNEEKISIISEKGYSEDISQASSIAEFLIDDDNEVVGQTCFYLGYLGDRNYISKIKDFLNSDDYNLLNFCLSGLALMVDERDDYLLDQVLPLINHESILVRMSAVEVLGNIRSKKALKVLTGNFDQEAPAVQYEIIRALGKIGDDGALPLLQSYKKTVDAMDHAIPRKGATRGDDPHPDVLELAVVEAIAALESKQ